jgi:hypothetical protein
MMTVRRRWLLAAWLLASVVPAAWAQGYRVSGNLVEVDNGHLQQWAFPAGSVTFDNGVARPRQVLNRRNAIADAPMHTDADGVSGGIRAAGSNPAAAAALLDGDLSTWWEPDADDPLDNWWVEIDLGRLVWASKIVVHFVGAAEGDPFLQFKLLTSDGEEAFLQSGSFKYVTAGRSEGLNKTQRTFEFDLTTAVVADGDFVGDIIQYLQIVVTATDGRRAERIAETAWNGLVPGERGDIVYFRQDSGRLGEIDQTEFEGLDESRRGPIHHYRRELPRLADIEVWTEGDNVSLGTVDRGGRIQGFGNLGAEVLTIDGNGRTFWSVEVGYNVFGFGTGGVVELGIQDPDREVFLDLGSWFWIDRMLIVFDRSASGGAFPNYVVNLSDGSQSPDGRLLFVPVAQRGNGGLDHTNQRLFLQRSVFPLQPARYVRMDYHIVESSIRSNIKEIMLHGQGFLPEVTLTSDMIDLGAGSRILSDIHWNADVPSGTQLRVRTRSGNEVSQRITYFTNLGTEVTEAQYRKLLSFQKGDSLVTAIPGSDWSPWSKFYAVSGEAITSPSPRDFLMVQATLVTNNPDQAVSLRGMQVGLLPPLAARVIGEVGPHRVAVSGDADTLTAFLQPTIDGSRGFDQVRIGGPPGARLEMLDVRGYMEGDTTLVDRYGQGEFEILPSTADSIWIRLPERIEDNRILAIRFTAELYLASNPFQADVGLGEGDDVVWQRVDADDVTHQVDGSGMTVFTPFQSPILGQVTVTSSPMTPNGDGINDRTLFEFPVFKVQGSKELQLEVFALDGRQVVTHTQFVEFAAGQQQLQWDGRGNDGQLVPPGIYLARIEVDVDASNRKAQFICPISVVY